MVQRVSFNASSKKELRISKAADGLSDSITVVVCQSKTSVGQWPNPATLKSRDFESSSPPILCESSTNRWAATIAKSLFQPLRRQYQRRVGEKLPHHTREICNACRSSERRSSERRFQSIFLRNPISTCGGPNPAQSRYAIIMRCQKTNPFQSRKP